MQAEAKMIWGRKDADTGDIFIRYDRLVTDENATRVEMETVWEKFDRFVRDYPRAQLPYRSATETRSSTVCNRQVAGYQQMNAMEEPLGGTDFDKQDLPELLDYERPTWVMDEGKIREAWNAEFVVD